MASRRLLVVATVPVDGDVLREQIRRATGEAEVEIRIVAPAARLSPLEWLASDEDEARHEAAVTASQTAGEASAEGEVERAEVGDVDPAQAIEDALREFPADEVVVATREGEKASWLEEGAGEEARERFGVPIREIVIET